MPGEFSNESAANAEIARLEAEIARLGPLVADDIRRGERQSPNAIMMFRAQQALARAKDALGSAKTQDQSNAAGGQRNDVISNLDRIAKGYGQAYGTTMGQVNQGNQRIAALAASGRGGLNAGVNSQNAQALNKTAGHQQATIAKQAEMSQARGALGQAIAAGQDYNVAEGQATLEALRNTPAAAPNQGMQLAGQLGAAGQAVWSANQGGQQDPNDANRKRNW